MTEPKDDEAEKTAYYLAVAKTALIIERVLDKQLRLNNNLAVFLPALAAAMGRVLGRWTPAVNAEPPIDVRITQLQQFLESSAHAAHEQKIALTGQSSAPTVN